MSANQTVVANLTLTQQEAADGCVKQIFLEGMLKPIDVMVPSGAVSGRALTINSVLFADKNGGITCKTLYIAVWIQNGKKPKRVSTLKIFAACVALIIAIVMVSHIFPTQRRDTRFFDGQIQEASGVVPNFEQRYYLHTLPDAMQDVVSILYQTILDFKGQCQLPIGIRAEEFRKLLYLMKAECPELFQLDLINHVKYYYDTDTTFVYAVYFQYQMTETVYEERLFVCEQKLDLLFEQTQGMTNAEKEKFVFDYLALHTYYDVDSEMAYSAYGALVEGNAKCDGISLAMKWCMERMDMACLCIFADAKEGTVGHAWNMVLVDDVYCNVDLTASVRYRDNDNTIISDVIIYPLYHVSDLWNEQEFVVCDAFDYWAKKPVCLTDLFSFYQRCGRLHPNSENASSIVFENLSQSLSNGTAVDFQVESLDTYNEMKQDMESIATSWLQIYGKDRNIYVEWAFFTHNVVWVRVTQR